MGNDWGMMMYGFVSDLRVCHRFAFIVVFLVINS